MKRIILAMLLLCGIAAAQPNCGMETVRGTYAVSYIGWVAFDATTPPIPGVIFGIISIDWNGALSGVASIGGLGPVTDYEVVSGTIKINPDCTGTIQMTSKPKEGGPATSEVDRIIVFPKENEIRAIISELPGTYPAMLGVWKLITTTPNAVKW